GRTSTACEPLTRRSTLDRASGARRDDLKTYLDFQNPAAMRGNDLRGAADLWSAIALAKIGSLARPDDRKPTSGGVCIGRVHLAAVKPDSSGTSDDLERGSRAPERRAGPAIRRSAPVRPSEDPASRGSTRGGSLR